MIEPGFERVHPSTILLSAVQVIRQMIWVLIVMAIQIFTNRDRLDAASASTEFFLSGLGGIAVIVAVIQYFSFGYAVRNGALEIRSGIFAKRLRTIPIDRIQNVNIARPFLHRLLGLVELQVETASGAGTEAKISALKEYEAEQLKAKLTGVAARSEVFAREKPDVAYQATLKELIIAGATENRVFTIIAAIFGVLQFGNADEEFIVSFIKTYLVQGAQVAGWKVYALTGVGLLLLGWIVSIVMTLLQYWDFEIVRERGKLKRTFGLLNQIENVLPPGRVQIMRQTQSFIQRWLGYGKLFVETAGSFELNEQAGKSVFTPIALTSELPRLTQLVFPGLDAEQLTWQAVPKRGVWIGMFWPLVFYTLLFVATFVLPPFLDEFSVATWLWVRIGLVLFAIITVLSSWLDTVKARYAWDGQFLASRRGVLTVIEEYLPLRKVQCIFLNQTPFQRRLDLATLVFVTAAPSPSGKFLEMKNIDRAEAERIMEEVHEAVRDHANWSSQGF